MGENPSAYVLIQHPARWQKGVPDAIHWDMASKKIEMVGNRYGRLVVVGDAPDRKCPGGQIKRRVQARCDCGTWKVFWANTLRGGVSMSCGCLQSEIITNRNTKHGMYLKDPEYGVWKGMIYRCDNPRNPAYHNYGGRGITVCERWRNDYEVFLADMGHRPTPRHSIDRFPDNDGPYSPENCRWATSKQQRANQRNSGR